MDTYIFKIFSLSRSERQNILLILKIALKIFKYQGVSHKYKKFRAQCVKNHQGTCKKSKFTVSSPRDYNPLGCCRKPKNT